MSYISLGSTIEKNNNHIKNKKWQINAKIGFTLKSKEIEECCTAVIVFTIYRIGLTWTIIDVFNSVTETIKRFQQLNTMYSVTPIKNQFYVIAIALIYAYACIRQPIIVCRYSSVDALRDIISWKCWFLAIWY